MHTQINGLTKMEYQGKNQGELQQAKELNGFNSNEWVTFLQAQELKLKIKKGSKSVAIFKGFSSGTIKEDDGKIKTVSVINGFARVFNLDQTEAKGAE